jgi:DNA-binding transcriptional LysR family regulator
MALETHSTRNGKNARRSERGLDLNRVAIFVQIADAKGVGAAAARAKLPKSSVSRALTQLEDELGVELLVRRSRAFQLTEAGQTFYDAAAKALASVHEARDELVPEASEPRGFLRVAAPPGFANVLVTPTIVEFVRRYPEMEVELSVTAARVDPIRDGFDVVFAIGTLEDSSAKVRRFATMDAGVFASEAYLAARGAPRRPSDLARHDCILQTRSAPRSVWTLRGPAGTTSVTVHGRIAVDDQFSAVAAAAVGGGLVVLPIHLVERDPSARALRRVLSVWIVPGEAAQIVYAASRDVPLRVSMFCEALMELKNGCEAHEKGASMITTR